MYNEVGVPYGNRTRVSAVKGQRPRPLDEGNAVAMLVDIQRWEIKRETIIFLIKMADIRFFVSADQMRLRFRREPA